MGNFSFLSLILWGSFTYESFLALGFFTSSPAITVATALVIGFSLSSLLIPSLMTVIYRKRLPAQWGLELSSLDLKLCVQALEVMSNTPQDIDAYQVLATKGGLSPNVRQALIPLIREMSKPLASAWASSDSKLAIALAREVLEFKGKIPKVTFVFGIFFSLAAYFILSF